jgi:two-component system, cell cycle sensor histidine kinase and response regulator CckA
VPSGETSQQSKRTILVVDDEPDVLHLIQSILAENGYEVVVATSADLAMQAFGRMPQRPDLVLTDVVMPGISGPMLIDRLLALDPHLRVLFMSGYDDRQVVQRYVVEKGFQLISKPFTVKTLRSTIEAVLNDAPLPPPEPAS